MSDFEPPFGTEEAARRLGRPASWLRTHRNEVPYIRMGRLVRYTQACIDTYLARQVVDANPLGRSARSKGKAA